MPIDYAVNVMNCYRRATPAELADGEGWYERARQLALELSPGDVWRGAGVISALSPMRQWPLNVKHARQSFETGIAKGNFSKNNAIAQRILDGEPTLEVIKGAKTRSFAIAIATGGRGEIATIDRHAHDIAMGKVFTEKTRNITKKKYEDMARAYQEVADYTDNAVNDIQAITWVVWKREKGHKK